MIGYLAYAFSVWASMRLVLVVCRACSSGELVLRRAYTGKTALSTLRFRFYWYPFVLFSPLLYGLSGFLGWGIPLFGYFVAMSFWIAFYSLLMRPIGGLVNFDSGADYEAWLRAGGHPYWESNTWCNFDRAVVRAAIGRPPENDYCFNCGADLRGVLNCGGNFGNRCNCCGTYNDIFEEAQV